MWSLANEKQSELALVNCPGVKRVVGGSAARDQKKDRFSVTDPDFFSSKSGFTKFYVRIVEKVSDPEFRPDSTKSTHTRQYEGPWQESFHPQVKSLGRTPVACVASGHYIKELTSRILIWLFRTSRPSRRGHQPLWRNLNRVPSILWQSTPRQACLGRGSIYIVGGPSSKEQASQI